MGYDTVINNEEITALPDSEWKGVIIENDYSLEEKLIGSWQGKPLYRKCFDAKTPSEIDKNKEICTITNFSEMAEITRFGMFTRNQTAGFSYNLGFESISAKTSGAYVTAKGTIMAWVGSTDWCNNDVKVVLEYTKKADA